MRKFILLLIISIILGLGMPVKAQNPVSDQDTDLMQRAQMVAEIRKLRAENEVIKAVNLGLKEQIKTYELLYNMEEARIADLKEANKDWKEALLHSKNSESLSDKMEAVYKESISDYRVENQRLRIENEKLRKSRDRRSLIFGIIGAAAGSFIF